jgi:hypothetical protein
VSGWWRSALLVLATARVDAADFTTPPPYAIAGFHEWEVVTGELVTPGVAGGYRFFVNPERRALYSVMRYRLRARPGSTEIAPAEKFLWVERPGEPVPMRCFELRPSGGSGSGTAAAWREMEPGTEEYLVEMQTVMAVLAARRRENSDRLPEAR